MPLAKFISISKLLVLIYFFTHYFSITPVEKSNFYINNFNDLLLVSTTNGIVICSNQNSCQKKNNLFDPNIQSSFFEDSSENIWFTTYQAIHVYDRSIDDFRYFQMISGTGDTIREDYKALDLNQEKLLIRAGKEMFLFDVSSEKMISAFQVNTSDYNNEVCIDYENTILCGFVNNNKLLVLNTDLIDLEMDSTFVKDKPYHKIEKWKDHFLLSDHDGQMYSLNTKENIWHKMDLKFDAINDLFNYKDSLLFILTDDEIIQKDLADISGKHKSFPLPAKGNPITVYVDELENLFVSIDGKGVYFFNLNKQKFQHFELNQNGKVANARGLAQDENGRYWYTSRDHGIGVFNEEGILLDSYNKDNGKCPHNLVFNLCFTQENEIWAASGYDIIKYSPDKNKFQSVQLSNDEKFYFSINQFKNGKLITIANDEDEILEIIETDNGYKLSPIVLDPPTETYLLSTIEDSKGNILIDINARRIGIYRFSNDTLKLQHTIDINSSLRWIWETNVDNEYYISTTNGLYHFPNGLESTYNKIDDDRNRLSQTVYCVLGYENYLWLSTNTGLFHYNIIDSSLHQYSLADGIQGMEFNTTGGLIDSKGHFLFGGTNGINYFDPSSIKLSQYNTPIYLSNIRINDEDWITEHNISRTKKIVQDFRNNTLTFIFNGIDYSDPGAIRLRYKMVGEDDHWVYINENNGFARYSNLQPGQYSFDMQATNSDGVWSNRVRSIDIQILPPFWQKTWFRFLVFIVLLGIIWSIFRSIHKRELRRKDLELREQKLELEKQIALQNERNRIATEMHDDLGGGLTTINFLSQKLLRGLNEGPNKDALRKILANSSQLVTNMSEIIWAMNSKFDSLENLIAYIRRYARNYLDDHDINLVFLAADKIPELEISGMKRRHVFLVIKEALHNIVKHSNADQVRIVISINSKILELIISDNGIGLEENAKSTGHGLANMQSRIEDIHGQVKIISESGTKINIEIPLHIT